MSHIGKLFIQISPGGKIKFYKVYLHLTLLGP